MNLTKNKKKQIEGIDFTKSYKISDAVKIIKEKNKNLYILSLIKIRNHFNCFLIILVHTLRSNWGISRKLTTINYID